MVVKGSEPEWVKMVFAYELDFASAVRRNPYEWWGVSPNIPFAPCQKFWQAAGLFCWNFWGFDGQIIVGEFMKKIIDYIKSVRGEWFKIVWPSRDAVIRATIMILTFSALAALFFFLVDGALNAIVGWIFK